MNTANGGYPVVGSGSSMGISSGYAQVGDVIRFGNVGNSVAGAGGTYYGDAMFNYIAITGTGACFIASTEGHSVLDLGTSAGVTTVFTVFHSFQNLLFMGWLME